MQTVLEDVNIRHVNNNYLVSSKTKKTFIPEEENIMALGNRAAESQAPKAPTENKAVNSNKTANEDVIAQGNALIAEMTEEQRSALGSKAGTLHFKHLLGLASKKSRRKVSKDESLDCSTPVGIVFVSDEEIQVPVIDIKKDKTTGIAQEDITYRTVKAGEEFFVSYYEYMYLILRDEYAGLCEAKGDVHGAYFSPKLPAFAKGDAQLPTPTINLKSGSVKENMIDIDQKVDNTWVIKEGYEKFADLLKKSTPKRSSGTKNSTPTPTVVAVALQKLLGIKQ